MKDRLINRKRFKGSSRRPKPAKLLNSNSSFRESATYLAHQVSSKRPAQKSLGLTFRDPEADPHIYHFGKRIDNVYLSKNPNPSRQVKFLSGSRSKSPKMKAPTARTLPGRDKKGSGRLPVIKNVHQEPSDSARGSYIEVYTGLGSRTQRLTAIGEHPRTRAQLLSKTGCATSRAAPLRPSKQPLRQSQRLAIDNRKPFAGAKLYEQMDQILRRSLHVYGSHSIAPTTARHQPVQVSFDQAM